MSEPVSHCRNCGAEITPDAPFGNCAKCLLQLGFGPLPTELDDSRPSPHISVNSFGDYEIIEVIGRGGMGLVYKARQRSTDRVVALKTILAELPTPALAQRFQIEAEAAGNLEHPNIVSIFEVGTHRGRQYLAMQFIEGSSLDKLITPLGLADATRVPHPHPGHAAQVLAAKLMAQVARAVHYAHERGVLHRDLKPSNILVGQDGTPYLTDFGIAKIVRQTHGVTVTGAVIGTPSYMAPEQAAGQTKSLTTAADVYSLGAILYELLTGQPPFRGDTPVEILRKVIEKDPQHPQTLNSLVDENLATVCLKCLDKDSRQRYSSAGAFADDLERWLRGEPILARRPSVIPAVKRWVRQHPVPATAGVGALVLVLSLIALLSVKYRDEKEKARLLSVNLQVEEEREKTRKRWRAHLAEELKMLISDPNARLVRVGSEQRALLAGTGLELLPEGTTPVRITFGVYQHSDPIRMVDAFHPILAYLENTLTKELREPVVIDFVIYASYELGEAALAHGEVHFMRVGPATYVLARNENPTLTLLAGQTHADFAGAVFTRIDSGIRAPPDLRQGHSFAFGARNSTATLFAKAKLAELGIYRTDFLNVVYRRNHDDVRKAVLEESFSAGAAKITVTAHPSLTNVLTFPIIGMPWVATTNLAPRLAQSITRNLLALQDSRILSLIEDDLIGFTHRTDGDYDAVRSVIAAARSFDER